jgi:hypothetical protein
MTRMVEAIRNYKDKVELPHVAVLLGNVWGGVSASAVPNADLIVATSGTNFGFAGPNVIEAFEGLSVPATPRAPRPTCWIATSTSCSPTSTTSCGTSGPCSLDDPAGQAPPAQRRDAAADPQRHASDQRRSFDFGPVGIYGPRFDDMKGGPNRCPPPRRARRTSAPTPTRSSSSTRTS